MLLSQNTEVFFRGRKLWHYICRDAITPTQKEGELVDKIASRLEDWESANYSIISWFINTSVPSIHSLLPKFGYAKVAQEFLAKRYNCTYDALLGFQIETKLYQTCQKPGHSITNFYSQTNNLWEQLSTVDHQLNYYEDVKIFARYRDRRKFIHCMITLLADFEPTWAFLLHCTPLPTLEVIVAELISKET